MSPAPILHTVIEARLALRWTQRDLGQKLGASMRTASRWETGRSSMHGEEISRLARHVYPVRPDLAQQLAASIGETLVSLGIVATSAAGPVGPRVMTTKDLLDAITYAVADAANTAPRQVRALVLLTLRKAYELRMDLGSAAKEGALAEDATPGALPVTSAP